MQNKLLDNKSMCSGCGACSNICPAKAISMEMDEYGFIFPKIDRAKCVGCELCIKSCHYKREMEYNNVEHTYAATIQGDQIKDSSSGGIFFAMAREIISEGGCVIGVAMQSGIDEVYPQHIIVTEEKQLQQLQGSKYAQSRTDDIYIKTQQILLTGKKVLFSGTPCQIAALKSYLKKEYNNLYTVDVICHGVPSAKMFDDYLKFLSQRWNVKVINYRFRDKQLGWGINMRAYLKCSNGKLKEKIIPPEMSSFFSMFLSSDITRDSCIGCRYASAKRVGDITLGDYWGIGTAHPEAVRKKILNENKGVSSVFVNSKKGLELIQQLEKDVVLLDSKYDLVIRHNGQAEKAVVAKSTRGSVLEVYRTGGYAALDEYYWRLVGKKKYYYIIKNKIPRKLRLAVKRLCHNRRKNETISKRNLADI